MIKESLTLRHCATVHDCTGCGYGCDTNGLPRNRDLLNDAADAIEELSERADELGEELTAAMELVHKRNDKIEKLKAAVPHWISVEERLPEPYQNVLTCAWKLFGPDRKRVCGIDYVLDNGEWACGGESYKTMVTHWMPLPSTEGLK